MPLENQVNETFTQIAILTPTYNRLHLLQRLYQSLAAQQDLSFVWVVVDDASTDGTSQWIESVAHEAPFPVVSVRNPRNIGKCRSLNRGFDAVNAELFVVVDSDDWLVATATTTIRTALEAAEDRVGALFFRYLDQTGRPLGGPPNGTDLIASRAILDSKWGKYDGCVAYRSRVIDDFRYPEYADETYLAPTVLQLLMARKYKLLFSSNVVGVADYQPDGLTRGGRALRLRNPRGMMIYSKLNAEQGRGWRYRMKFRVSYWAYRTTPMLHVGEDARDVPTPPKGPAVDVILGWCVGARWRWASRGEAQ